MAVAVDMVVVATAAAPRVDMVAVAKVVTVVDKEVTAVGLLAMAGVKVVTVVKVATPVVVLKVVTVVPKEATEVELVRTCSAYIAQEMLTVTDAGGQQGGYQGGGGYSGDQGECYLLWCKHAPLV